MVVSFYGSTIRFIYIKRGYFQLLFFTNLRYCTIRWMGCHKMFLNVPNTSLCSYFTAVWGVLFSLRSYLSPHHLWFTYYTLYCILCRLPFLQTVDGLDLVPTRTRGAHYGVHLLGECKNICADQTCAYLLKTSLYSLLILLLDS